MMMQMEWVESYLELETHFAILGTAWDQIHLPQSALSSTIVSQGLWIPAPWAPPTHAEQPRLLWPYEGFGKLKVCSLYVSFPCTRICCNLRKQGRKFRESWGRDQETLRENFLWGKRKKYKNLSNQTIVPLLYPQHSTEFLFLLRLLFSYACTPVP